MSGLEYTMPVIWALLIGTAVTPFSWKARCEVGPSARSMENTASSAVKGVPSWKTTFGRSLKRQASGPAGCHDTARPGSSSNFSSRVTSDS